MRSLFKLLANHFVFSFSRNASQIVKVGGGSKPKTGKAAMNSVEVLTNHSMLVDASGAISSIVPSGAATEALEHSLGGNVAQVVDCAGKCVLPGFVDGHTHAIFAGDRSHEHAMKLAGASYEEVEVVRPQNTRGGRAYLYTKLLRFVGVPTCSFVQSFAEHLN